MKEELPLKSPVPCILLVTKNLFSVHVSGTVYWQAEERDGILLMSAYCVYCCASPLFLSSVLMAHLNKALDVSFAFTFTIQRPGLRM